MCHYTCCRLAVWKLSNGQISVASKEYHDCDFGDLTVVSNGNFRNVYCSMVTVERTLHCACHQHLSMWNISVVYLYTLDRVGNVSKPEHRKGCSSGTPGMEHYRFHREDLVSTVIRVSQSCRRPEDLSTPCRTKSSYRALHIFIPNARC